jgi:hypothetical protein
MSEVDGIRIYQKRGKGEVRTISLYFMFTDGWCRVYQYAGGGHRNWEVTVGRRWKNELEANEFLGLSGWEKMA